MLLVIAFDENTTLAVFTFTRTYLSHNGSLMEGCLQNSCRILADALIRRWVMVKFLEGIICFSLQL